MFDLCSHFVPIAKTILPKYWLVYQVNWLMFLRRCVYMYVCMFIYTDSTLQYDLILWALPGDIQFPLLPPWSAEDMSVWHLPTYTLGTDNLKV